MVIRILTMAWAAALGACGAATEADEPAAPVREVVRRCEPGGAVPGPASPRPQTAQTGERLVLEGFNGRFVSRCEGDVVASFECEVKSIVYSTRLGPMEISSTTGNVVPSQSPRSTAARTDERAAKALVSLRIGDGITAYASLVSSCFRRRARKSRRS